MKIRKGFVSNSSSSSFVCDICGGIEAGYDVSLSDLDMVECVNGHCFDESCGGVSCHIEGRDEKIKVITEYYERRIKNAHDSYKDRYIKYFEDFKAEVEDLNDDNLDDIIDDEVELRYSFPASLCPICNLEKPQDSDVVNYMYTKFGTTKEKIFKEMQEKFSGIDELNEYLKNK